MRKLHGALRREILCLPRRRCARSACIEPGFAQRLGLGEKLGPRADNDTFPRALPHLGRKTRVGDARCRRSRTTSRLGRDCRPPRPEWGILSQGGTLCKYRRDSCLRPGHFSQGGTMRRNLRALSRLGRKSGVGVAEPGFSRTTSRLGRDWRAQHHGLGEPMRAHPDPNGAFSPKAGHCANIDAIPVSDRAISPKARRCAGIYALCPALGEGLASGAANSAFSA